MEPLYIAKKSIIPAFKWWRVLLFWLIIPSILIVADIIKFKAETIEFYDSYVLQKKGVFTKTEKKSIFPKILGINSKISILGYGDLYVDVVGNWDVELVGMANPKELRSFLESQMVSSATVDKFSSNTFTVSKG